MAFTACADARRGLAERDAVLPQVRAGRQSLARGEQISMNGQSFVAGSDGATLKLRDGKLVLTGAKKKQ
jgi:hypothetical protein